MKRLLLCTTAALTTTLILLAQVPQGVNFQAIARDASGFSLSGANVTADFRIRDGGGTLVYAEQHATTTDLLGLFQLVIGAETPSLGNFAALDWGLESIAWRSTSMAPRWPLLSKARLCRRPAFIEDLPLSKTCLWRGEAENQP